METTSLFFLTLDYDCVIVKIFVERSDIPTFKLEEMTDHPVDTDRTFDCVSIFIDMEIKLG